MHFSRAVVSNRSQKCDVHAKQRKPLVDGPRSLGTSQVRSCSETPKSDTFDFQSEELSAKAAFDVDKRALSPESTRCSFTVLRGKAGIPFFWL